MLLTSQCANWLTPEASNADLSFLSRQCLLKLNDENMGAGGVALRNRELAANVDDAPQRHNHSLRLGQAIRQAYGPHTHNGI